MKWKRALSRGIAEIYSLGHLSTPARGLRILLYHAVGTCLDCNRRGLSIAPDLFRRHVTSLKQNQSVMLVPLEPLLTNMSDGTRVALTFDDGYRDTLLIAAPILADLGIPFTVFVVPNYIKSGNSYYLTASQLKELATIPGCAIGSHSMNHLRLVELDQDALRRELKDSRQWLEDMLSQAVSMLAYPHGLASQRVRDAAAGFGYTLGVCSRTGINDKHRDPLMLCRTEILGCDNLRVFNQKLLGGWDWLRFRHRDPASL